MPFAWNCSLTFLYELSVTYLSDSPSSKKVWNITNELIIEKDKEQIHEYVFSPCDTIVIDKGLDVLTTSRHVSNSVASHLSSMRTLLKHNVYCTMSPWSTIVVKKFYREFLLILVFCTILASYWTKLCRTSYSAKSCRISSLHFPQCKTWSFTGTD